MNSREPIEICAFLQISTIYSSGFWKKESQDRISYLENKYNFQCSCPPCLNLWPTNGSIPKGIHGRRGGSWLGYPPPEKFWFEIPPLREGYSLAKYSPPLEMFLAKYPKSPPPDQNFFRNFQKISEFWSRVV